MTLNITEVQLESDLTRRLKPTEIGNGLRDFIDGTRVLIREIERVAFAPDASFYRLIPLAVVQPKNSDEARQLFHYSREQKTPLTFRSGGTSLSGQAITDGISVDVGPIPRSVGVEDNEQLLRAQPGVIGQLANLMLHEYGAKIGPIQHRSTPPILAASSPTIVSRIRSNIALRTPQVIL